MTFSWSADQDSFILSITATHNQLFQPSMVHMHAHTHPDTSKVQYNTVDSTIKCQEALWVQEKPHNWNALSMPHVFTARLYRRKVDVCVYVGTHWSESEGPSTLEVWWLRCCTQAVVVSAGTYVPGGEVSMQLRWLFPALRALSNIALSVNELPGDTTLNSTSPALPLALFIFFQFFKVLCECLE